MLLTQGIAAAVNRRRRVFMYQLCSDEEADSYRFMQILAEAVKAGAVKA